MSYLLLLGYTKSGILACYKVFRPAFLCKMESSQVLARTKSLFLIAVRLNDKSARTMNQAVIKSLGKINTSKVNTMTFDNGKEFSDFKGLEKAYSFFRK